MFLQALTHKVFNGVQHKVVTDLFLSQLSKATKKCNNNIEIGVQQ